MAEERGGRRPSGRRAVLRGVARSLAVMMLTVGVNGVLASLAPRYEPVYLSLAAVALIGWFDGFLAGLVAALVLAGMYEVLFSPLHGFSGRSTFIPVVAALLLATLAALARRIHARPALTVDSVAVPAEPGESQEWPAVVAALDHQGPRRTAPQPEEGAGAKELQVLRAEVLSLRAQLGVARSENDQLSHASRTIERDAKTQLAQERARGTAREDGHTRLTADLAQAVATIQRLREEAGVAQQEIASLHEQQQGDGNAVATALADLGVARTAAEQLRATERAAAAQIESSQKRIRDLTEELGAAAKRTASALDRAEAETATRVRKEQEFAAHEQRLHEQYEAESEHLQSAASSALEEIQRLRAANDELRKSLTEAGERHESAGRELVALRSGSAAPTEEQQRDADARAAIEQERDSLRAAVAAAEARVNDLQKSQDAVLAELRHTRSAEEKLRAESEGLRLSSAELAASRGRIEELVGALARESSLRKEAEERLAQSQSAGASGAQQLEQARQRLARAEAEGADLRRTNEQHTVTANEKLAAALAAREAAVEELQRTRAAEESLRHQLDEVRSRETAVSLESEQLREGLQLAESERAGHAAEREHAAASIEEGRAWVGTLQARIGELQVQLEDSAHAAAVAAESAREQLEREWSDKLQGIVTSLAFDHESDVGDLMTEREGARAETRSAVSRMEELQRAAGQSAQLRASLEEKILALDQQVQAERARVTEALASRESLDQQWGEKLQQIVTNLASDHENDLGEAVMLRESARAEARSLEKRVQLLQKAVQEAQGTRTPLEERTTQLQAELEAERLRADEEQAARVRIEADWSDKLQTIVSHLASDHESDMGQALMEKEGAKAEARTLGMRVHALQQKLESDRGALDKALEKWNGVRQSLLGRLARAESELEALRGPGRDVFDTGEPASGTTDVFPPPSMDVQRARAEVLEVAEQAQEAFRRATSSGTVRVPSTSRRPLVLIVDQDPGVRGTSRETLISNGFDVLTASDGLEGLRIAISHKPEIVIADASMPKMDGRELCQLIKSNQATAGVKVILMTGSSPSEGSDQIPPELAPDTLLQKPVRFDVLQATLSTLLQQA